jgi:hypothetical protein
MVMNKILFAFYISLSITLLHAQNTSSLSVSYDKYFDNDNNNFLRKSGITFGFGYEIGINEFNTISLGVNSKFVQEEYPYLSYLDLNYSSKKWDTLIYDYKTPSGLTLCIDIPFVMSTNLYKSKLFLLYGLNFSFERVLTHTSTQLSDPEYDNRSYPDHNISFGYRMGLLYALNKRFSLFGDFKSNINKDYSFSNISLGIKMKINNQ